MAENTNLVLQHRRVLLVGYDTAGFLTGLHRGLRSIGHTVSRIGPEHPFSYGSNSEKSSKVTGQIGASVTAFLRRSRTFFLGHGASPLRRVIGGAIQGLVLVSIAVVKLPQAVVAYWKSDLVIFNNGMTVTGTVLDFPLARVLKCRVLTSFHGSDVRPAYIDGAVWRHSSMTSGQLRRLVRRQARRARYAEQYSTAVVAWCGISHFFTRRIWLHEQLGFPLSKSVAELEDIAQSRALRKATSTVLVVHMPTNPPAKGSREIEQLVRSVQTKNNAVEFHQFTGLPHEQALLRLSEADIVIDQIFSDSATGVLAAEASILRKPVLIAGPDSSWIKNTLGSDCPPTDFVSGDDLENELIKLVQSEKYRNQIAAHAYDYFSRRWDCSRVASRYMEIVFDRNSEPSFDPLMVSEPRGGFAPQAEIRDVVSAYVARFGVDALYLNANPGLRNNLIEVFGY